MVYQRERPVKCFKGTVKANLSLVCITSTCEVYGGAICHGRQYVETLSRPVSKFRLRTLQEGLQRTVGRVTTSIDVIPRSAGHCETKTGMHHYQN